MLRQLSVFCYFDLSLSLGSCVSEAGEKNYANSEREQMTRDSLFSPFFLFGHSPPRFVQLEAEDSNGYVFRRELFELNLNEIECSQTKYFSVSIFVSVSLSGQTFSISLSPVANFLVYSNWFAFLWFPILFCINQCPFGSAGSAKKRKVRNEIALAETDVHDNEERNTFAVDNLDLTYPSHRIVFCLNSFHLCKKKSAFQRCRSTIRTMKSIKGYKPGEKEKRKAIEKWKRKEKKRRRREEKKL